MRLINTLVGLMILSGLCLGPEARAGTYVFDTESTATQMLTSPLLGGTVSITAHGPQQFTIDTTSGTAGVTSAFQGSDFPNPSGGAPFTYDLYNTTTTGTVTATTGGYDISYQLLFELKLTSGPLAGLIFETLQDATFTAPDVSALPFPAGTTFSDPSGSDAVGVYIKDDPTGTFAAGTLVGSSFDRLVTINQVVPEPSSLTLTILAMVPGIGVAWRRRRRECAA